MLEFINSSKPLRFLFSLVWPHYLIFIIYAALTVLGSAGHFWPWPLFMLIITVLWNLYTMGYFSFNIGPTLGIASAASFIYRLIICLRLSSYKINTGTWLFAVAVILFRYAASRVFISFLARSEYSNDFPDFKFFLNRKDPNSPMNYYIYPVWSTQTSVLAETLFLLGLCLLTRGVLSPEISLPAKCVYSAVGVFLSVFFFRPAFHPGSEIVELFKQSKAYNDETYALLHSFNQKTEAAAEPLSRIADKPIRITGNKERWMTNKEAFNYFNNLYGDADSEDDAYRHYTEERCSISAPESIADAVLSGYFNDPRNAVSSYCIDQDADAQLKHSVQILRKNKEIAASLPDGCGTISELRRKQISEYLRLASGVRGEKAVSDAIAMFFSDESVKVFTDVNVSDGNSSFEHDVIIVCSKGIITFEVKNRSRYVKILPGLQIQDSAGRLDVDANGNNAISQAERHMSSLRLLLSAEGLRYAVYGAVIYANPDAVVINESAYPVLTLYQIRHYIESKPDILSKDDIRRAVTVINHNIVSAKRFPFTDIKIDYDNSFSDDYQKVAAWIVSLRKDSPIYDLGTELKRCVPPEQPISGNDGYNI